MSVRHFISEKVTRLDLTVWALVMIFFCVSALIQGGDLEQSFLGASGIIVVMFFIGGSIEIIIESLKNVKGLGTIVGFITNGPETLCLLVGLFITRDILFAASTPLGSNFMNPLLLIVAALLTGSMVTMLGTRRIYTLTTIALSAALAVGFYLISEEHFPVWLLVTGIISILLFVLRPREEAGTIEPEEVVLPKVWLLMAVLMLLGAGYFLDPAVQFTAEASKAPAGVIGFLVLATLTSWPEFKSSLSLIKRGRFLAAILNITVSNITNLWLAGAGVAYYLAT